MRVPSFCLLLASLGHQAAAQTRARACHRESIEQVAAAISNPESPRFRKFLTAAQAAKFADELPPIAFPSNSSAQRRGDRPAKRNARNSLGKPPKRDTCGADDLVTPTCIRQAYGVDYTPQPSRVTFAVYATEGSSFNPQDLDSFLRQYRPEAEGAEYDLVGSGDPSEEAGIDPQFETALDTQTLLGSAWPAKGILYNFGGVFGPSPGQPYKPFVDFLSDLIHNDTVPSVVSFSESMPEDIMDPAYAKTLCTMMALVGTRGISLLFSTGDNGPNGDQPSGTHKMVFEPEFPASCPWVTAVGGTTNLQNETAATNSTIPPVNKISYVASGGGFSNLFPRPKYQHSTVPQYIADRVPASYYSIAGFNASGRGIPDVSAFSTNAPTVVNNITVPIGGTSASTPLWAAIVTMLNDYEACEGRPPLGFLNPWLYSLEKKAKKTPALKDITAGGNSQGSCELLSGCTLNETLGYDVTAGWDPVTGLGSPHFARLTAELDAIRRA